VLVNARRLGADGPAVSAIGLGCMGMSGMYGPADRGEGIATIHTALEAGVDLLDTGDFYGMGHNELLIGEALRGRPREEYRLSVKFGAQRGPDGMWLGYDASPPAVKTALAHSLTAVHPICDVQIEYSLISRGVEAAILPACRELGVAITAYGVLSRGLISGHFAAERELAANDFRARAPRFDGENCAHNLALVDGLRAVADAKGASVAQVAIAWVLGRGEDIVALVGSRTRAQLDEALGAERVELDADDLAALERAIPPDAVLGERYPEPQMATLDSERA
jgi:aryl-alcohol dehydrogenase-like predicted oxidoreductase